MSTPTQPQFPVGKVGWWRRIGSGGQIAIITALIGVVTAGIPAAVTEGFGLFRESAASSEDTGRSGNGPTASPPTTSVVTATTATNSEPSTTATSSAESSISFEIMNQLTTGLPVEVLEENIHIQLGDDREKVWLRSSPSDPVTVERWTATEAGSYGYTLDITMTFRDGYGTVGTFAHSTTGSVYISDGSTLMVMLYFDSYGQFVNMELVQG